jgi:hypothetical protein
MARTLKRTSLTFLISSPEKQSKMYNDLELKLLDVEHKYFKLIFENESLKKNNQYLKNCLLEKENNSNDLNIKIQKNLFYTIKEASAVTGVGRRTLSRVAKKNNLEKVDNKYIFNGDFLIRYLEKKQSDLNFLKNISENTKDNIKTYLMKNNHTKLYKIGYSKNPKHREKTLQSEEPNIKMVKIWNKNIERKLHKLYSEYRVRGEWFNLTPVQVKYICTQF